MFVNQEQFIIEMKAGAEEIKNEAVIAQRMMALDIIRKLYERTPRKTGRARQGWEVSIDTWSETEAQHEDPVAYAESVLADLPFGAVIYFTNNVPYIKFLEQGSSKQAPHGFLALTMAEIRMKYENVLQFFRGFNS